jgi:SulP family sulfate permease
MRLLPAADPPPWLRFLPRSAMVAVLRHGYTRADLLADLGAGTLVGVVALPLSMALAIASGCKPEQGLWTAIIAGFIISALGGSRVQIGGPAAAFVALCASGVSRFGPAGLGLATVMAGALLLFLGLAKLGKAISYVPTPVVIGFTSAIAVILVSTQLGPALGIADPATPIDSLGDRLHHLWTHAGEASWRPAACCLATVVIILGLRRWNPRLPGALIALLVVGGTVALFHVEVQTILSRYGTIPHGLPVPALPTLGLPADWHTGDVFRRLGDLSFLALQLALLGAIESLLSAVVADGMSGFRHDPDAELVGQGVANLVSPFFLGMPATGVIARTSTNVRAGARSPVAGIVHALTVLAIMLVAAPLVALVPLSALAGVLLVVAWHMAEFRHWPHLLRAGRGDAALLPIAFLLTAFIGLGQAVLVGVTLAMFFFVKRMADATQVEPHRPDHLPRDLPPIPAGVEVYEVRGPFFFGAATMIRDLDTAAGQRARFLVLRIGQVPFIDATAAFSLRELQSSLNRRGGRLILCEVQARTREDLDRHGIAHLLGADGIHADLHAALAQARGLISPPIAPPAAPAAN